jgi:AraC-like DNA-binding protein
MQKQFLDCRKRVKIPLEKRLPLNIRSAGHALVNPGWRHAVGDVDRYNLYWGVAGEVNYTVNGRHCMTRPHEILIFPLNSRMGPAEQISEGEYRWFTMDGALAEDLFKQLKLEFFIPFDAGPCPIHLHENLMHSFDDITPVAAMNSEVIAYELLLSINNDHIFSVKDAEIFECKQIIDAEFTDARLDITAVADRIGLDRTVMARRFKVSNGISPSKYLQSKRLMLALKYLESGCSSVDTARHAGYNDAGYFARSFKRHFGLPPQAWHDSMSNNI